MIAKHLFTLGFVLFFSCSSNSIQQDGLKLRLIESELHFIGFYSLVSGPSLYFEDPIDDYNGGYKHRVFVSFYGIYSVVFIDKISLNIEGGPEKMFWFRKLNLDPLYSKYSFSEETDHFSILEWIDSDSFTFRISHNDFLGVLKDDGEWLEVKPL